jgi:hypothetical protein
MRISTNILSFLFILVSGLTSSAQTMIIPDTTFIIHETKDGNYHAIFIDTTKSSLYYDYINTFKFDESDSASYQASLDCMGPLSFIKYDVFNLPRQWNLLYVYKGENYLYSPSDYINNYRVLISDSTYTDYYGGGPFARKINSLTKLDNKTFQFELTSCNDIRKTIIIHIIDPQKGIAVFEDPSADADNKFALMVSAGKAKKFPVIVNYSTVRFPEFKFDKPDFDKLLK